VLALSRDCPRRERQIDFPVFLQNLQIPSLLVIPFPNQSAIFVGSSSAPQRTILYGVPRRLDDIFALETE